MNSILKQAGLPQEGIAVVMNMHEHDASLLARVRQAVCSLEPGAEVILYGSRARGTSVPESDWDLLILLDGDVPSDRIDRIRSQLYEIEWETCEVITSIIRSKAEWDSKLWRAMPFHQRVDTEGIAL